MPSRYESWPATGTATLRHLLITLPIIPLERLKVRPVEELPERQSAGEIGRRPNMTPTLQPIPEGGRGV